MRLLLFYTMIFLSCQKGGVDKNVKATEYFPNSINDYWLYTVYDSSRIRDHSNYPEKYNVNVKITGSKKLADSLDAMIWTYGLPWGNDINYVRSIGDSIKIFDTVYSSTIRYLEFPRHLYIVPFQTQQMWASNLANKDEYIVLETAMVKIDNVSFDNCIHIYRHYLGPNMEYKDEYWFKPYIGFVKIHLNHFDFGPITIVEWSLKEYSLK